MLMLILLFGPPHDEQENAQALKQQSLLSWLDLNSVGGRRRLVFKTVSRCKEEVWFSWLAETCDRLDVMMGEQFHFSAPCAKKMVTPAVYVEI
jgi:hypothetical protein